MVRNLNQSIAMKHQDQPVPPEKRIRVAVLSVVKHDYLPRAVATHPRFELVVAADDEAQPAWVHERNQAFATEFGLPYVRDVQRAITEFKPDAAVISSQAERHCDLGVRAANAGLHLILDKPLSTRLDDCVRITEIVRQRGVRSLIWNRNMLPALLHAREIVRRGDLGRLHAVHCDFYFSKDAGPPKGSRRPGDPPIDWMQRQIEAHADGSDGGVGIQPMGELQVEGIYPLAYLRMLTGTAVERVYALTTSHFHQAHADNHVDDLATVTLEMTGGVTGSLCLGRIGAASHPDLGEIKLHLLGSRGAMVINESRPEVAVYSRNQSPNEFKHVRIADENDFLLMDHFADAIDTGADTLLDAAAARDIAAVVDAALSSARKGCPVEVRRF